MLLFFFPCTMTTQNRTKLTSERSGSLSSLKASVRKAAQHSSEWKHRRRKERRLYLQKKKRKMTGVGGRRGGDGKELQGKLNIAGGLASLNSPPLNSSHTILFLDSFYSNDHIFGVFLFIPNVVSTVLKLCKI